MQSISTIKGDLSNITAPPFLLASQSTAEFPAYWAENPSVFCAAASEPSPERRALLVLRWFLAALRRQQYAGRDEKDGVKKPLNAFLGELFLAEWQDQMGETKLISEQVSHHPPITACYLWNDQHGVRVSRQCLELLVVHKLSPWSGRGLCLSEHYLFWYSQYQTDRTCHCTSGQIQ